VMSTGGFPPAMARKDCPRGNNIHQNQPQNYLPDSSTCSPASDKDG